MDVYYCLIHLPEVQTPELVVLESLSLAEANAALFRVSKDWPGFERLDLCLGSDLIRSFVPKAFGLLAVAA